MRVLSIVNRLCYVVCLMAIVVGATLSIIAIWSDFDDDLMWKGISTALVLFAAGILTIVVNGVIGARVVTDRAFAGPAQSPSPPAQQRSA
jgi:hypothetical protein